MSIALFASCNKEGDQTGTEDKGPQVTVAADALVLHLPFEDGSVAVGEGITFASKGGEADFVDGFIGKCYTNKSGDPAKAAYLKYDIAAENFVNDLESFTFSAWVKRPATGSGALFSINGGVDAFWWCTMQFIYDNIIYAELNTKSDYCQCCGFDGEIQIKEDDGKLVWCCPNCGNTDQSKMNVARRTCGYIGTQYWNQGRTQEIKDRVLHL